MAFPAFLDTNVLYGAVLSDTLLRLAERGTFRPLWSADVLDELQRNLVRHAGLAPGAAQRRIDQMTAAFEDAMVTSYDGLTSRMTCHPKDRHVLAAAVAGQAGVLVTFNIKDFPPESLTPHGLSVATPDDFLLDQVELYPGLVGASLADQVRTSQRPRLSYAELLGRLQRSGVPLFVAAVRRHQFDDRFGESRG